MRQCVIWAGLALGVPFGASAQRASIAKPVIETPAHGPVHVRNSAPSQWTGTTGWRLVRERSIDPDPATGVVIAQPVSLEVDRHGNIFETDWKVDGIQEFDSTGKFLRQIGRKGSGPGEFQVPISVAVQGDTMVAYASNQSQVSVWRTDGTLLKSWHVDFCCGSGPVLAPNGMVMIKIEVRSAGGDRDAMVRWHADGRMIDTMLLAAQPEVHAWRSPTGGTFPIPFGTWRIGTFDSHGSYISGNSAAYTLIVSPRGSDTARVIDVAGNRTAVDAAYVDSVFARYGRIKQIAAIAKRADIPTQQPWFIALHLDEHDNLWIERPDGRGTVSQFDVLDSGGIFLGSVAAPASAPGSMRFVRGRLYTTEENADGVIVINVYRINRNGH
jgi:hypothetical protein